MGCFYINQNPIDKEEREGEKLTEREQTQSTKMQSSKTLTGKT